ncbi:MULTISPECIES: ATP-binding protein [Microbacterium]|uniref:DNA-binding transcriptional activator of the SARP family n=1 Tax=Microbacterium saccharophilum TaxID=1213358 RepID=A0A7Z7GEU5_9MICO|nr:MULTISPECIES: AAA family ATPase [Microbacterium]SFI59416.1 DNA-binding transcriptional activator of the SARP family [Microbacterium saccharophilum]
MSVRIELFGPPRVRRDDADVRFDTRKAVALLALLVVTGREFGREALAGMLWPDLERSRARATLRRTISVAAAVGPALVVHADRVGMDAGAVDCDVVEFRRLASSPRVEDWRHAAAFAADRFLEGFSLRDSPPFEDWMLGVADELRDELSRTLARLVAAAVDRGSWPEALEHARRRVQVEPLSEPAHADLIRVSAWSGDRPGALQAYRSLVRLLDRELGVPPLPETLALHEDIRADRLARPTTAAAAAERQSPVSSEEPVAPVPTRLVGRDEQLARLTGAWREVPASGRLVGIVGDPGLGKTVLAAAIAGHADGRTIRIAGRSSETMLAYAAANDLVRSLLTLRPDLVATLGPSAAPLAALATQIDGAAPRTIRTPGDLQRVHEAVRTALEQLAAESPMLLVVDDAELLDRPSAALLGYLARRLPAGLLLVVAWAPGLSDGPLQQAVTEQGETLFLKPFNERQIAELAGQDLDAGEILRRTRGIPLLVREVVAAPSDAEAGQVREIVAARFAGASETARQVVAASVVIGTVATPELLRSVSGRDEAETVEAIEEAVARGLLVEHTDTPGYDAPHDLVRGAALHGLSLARRRLLHARVADVFVRRHAADPRATPAGSVAQHLAASGREEEAASWFLTAAAESASVSAHEESILQLRAALALGRRNVEVHAAIGAALVRLGRYEEALVALDQASALAEGEPERRSEIEHAIAGVHDRLGDWELAQAHLESASDLAADGLRGRRARALADLALVLHRRGQVAQARQTASAAREAAAASHDDAARTQADNVLGMIALADGQVALAEEHLRDAVVRARADENIDLLIAALNNLSRALSAAGSAPLALDTAREALALAQRQGDRHRLAALHSHVADLLHAAGREDEAIAELKLSAAAFADVQGSTARPEVWTLTEW